MVFGFFSVLFDIRLACLVELLLEEDPHFVLVPLPVPVQVVHREEGLRVPILKKIVFFSENQTFKRAEA